MKTLRFILLYLRWHYTRGIGDFFRNWRNLLWFLWHFFSVGLMARTLFSPWKRLGEERSGHFVFAEFATGLIIGLLMRLVGFVCRTALMLVGLAALAAAIAVGLVFFIVWLVTPFLVIGFLADGISRAVS